MSEAVGKWTALVLTCQNKNSAQAFQKELEIRQQKGIIDRDVLILTVEDPKYRVGSGGATINALLLVAEYLSAKAGYTVVNADVFKSVHIVIMHMGRDFPFDACGRTFTTLPKMSTSMGYEGLMCNIDSLLYTLSTKVTHGAPPGIWVCSTDMFLDIPTKLDIPWAESHDVVALSIPSTVEYAVDHGVYILDDKGCVEDIIYKGEAAVLEKHKRPDGKVNLVVGIVYFSPRITEKLLSLHAIPPLDACTYYGLDSGATPVEFSLFFDLVVPLCSKANKKDFIGAQRNLLHSTSVVSVPVTQDTSVAASTRRIARSVLWKYLHNFQMKVVAINDGSFHYMSLAAKDYMDYILRSATKLNSTHLAMHSGACVLHTTTKSNVSLGDSCVVINSVLDNNVTVGSHTIVSHSILPPGTTIGCESLVSGIQDDNGYMKVHRNKTVDMMKERYMKCMSVEDHMILQGFNIHIKTFGGSSCTRHVYIVKGKFDNLQACKSSNWSSFCNESWDTFFTRTGIREEDLWCDTEDEEKCILNARLFPIIHSTEAVGLQEVLWLQHKGDAASNPKMLEKWRTSWRLSMQEILTHMDLSMEFQRRRELFFLVGEDQIRDTLLNNRGEGLLALYNSAAVEGFAHQILEALDKVACECGSPGIAARTLGNIADVLGYMSRGAGGLRSGPAANQSWEYAFNLLERNDIPGGIQALAKERKKWLKRPDHLMRAARHYEGAAQILIRHAVLTAGQFMNPQLGGVLPTVGQWVIGESPARVDLAGGWSDTPPITYEHGGAVVNAAILVNGKKPIGAKVKKIPEMKIKLVLESTVGEDTIIELLELQHFDDYSQPQAPGALLKAAFLCAEVIKMPSKQTLAEQLSTNYGGGFELHSWSNLPHGSGLGTSSILAGVVMAVLWKTSGRMYTEIDLMHAVLRLEQMLTTGGGWQDQVGGLTPGIKMGHSKPSLPLLVEIQRFNIPPETVKAFEERLVLVYTGKTRLAKNLLQNVVRNWYARDPAIVQTEDNLVKCAHCCAKAFQDGDIEQVGACLDEYWHLKKQMATGCEPASVTQMISALKPILLGASLAGAGGGGFMYLITKQPNMQDEVKRILATVKEAEGAVLYDVRVCMEGLTVTVEE